MRLRLTALTLSLAALLSAGCPDLKPDVPNDTGDGPVDADGDGFSVDEDCDDDNADVNPDAEELCDGIDNNCDEVIDTDATDLGTFYADGDGDTYGNADDSVSACADAVPTGYVADNTDCDDAAADVNPLADEVCNDIDDNCDGAIDEDAAVDASSWFADTDADTYGDPAVEVAACSQPSGYVADNTDCDDNLADVNTDGTEICDGIDNDCDDTVDEDDATDALTWYADGDSDSYGDAAATAVACNAPSGYVADDTDCDDTANAVNPAATEYCDTIDNDCDGTIDEDDAADAGTFYVDGDGDGFGNASSAVTACYASSGGGSTDTGTSAPAAAIDASNTNLTDAITLAGCGAISSVTVTTDISHAYRGDLEISLTSPAGTNAVLNYSSFDGTEDFVGVWADAGGDFTPAQALATFIGEDSTGDWTLNVTDTYASLDDGTWNSWDIDVSCGQVTVADSTDCDDTTATTYPGADEYCNSVDDDCDSTIDEADAIDASTWYDDSDQDGYGDPAQAAVVTCYASGDYTSDNANDCNDSVATTYPGADEYCNGVDDDCDSTTDEDDALDATGWTLDGDGDGYGAGTATTQCSALAAVPSSDTGSSAPALYMDGAGDYVSEITLAGCGGLSSLTVSTDIAHDWRGDLDIDLTSPSGTTVRLRNNDINDMASGWVGVWADAGGDYVPDEAFSGLSGEDTSGVWTLTVSDYYPAYEHGTWNSWDINVSCLASYVADDGDCDDSDSGINPGATDLCDGIDNDCDGSEPTDQVDWYDSIGTWSDGTADWTGGTAASPLAVTGSEGTAVFCAGTYYVSMTAGSDLDLVGSTGDPADVVLDGGGTDRVVDVTSGADLNLVNLTVSNGYASKGANVRCDSSGSTVYTDNAVISGGSHASGYGAGIYADECDLDLENTEITGNSGEFGGGIYIKNADLDIVDSSIDSNTASDKGGGIRYITDSNGSTVNGEIHDTWVTNNTAVKGGGIAFYADADIFVDAECTSWGSGGFLSNTATEGGAVYLDTQSGTGVAGFGVSPGSDCDFGEDGAADDNTAEDVYIDGLSESHWFGNYTSFSCDDNGANDGCVLHTPNEGSWGDTTYDSTTSGYIRGNVILSDGSTLDDFSMYLTPSGDLDFYVASSSDGSNWTTEFVNTVSGGGGEGWYNSGYIGLDTTYGDYYALLVGWQSSAKYFYAVSGTASPGMGTIYGHGQQNSGYSGPVSSGGSGLSGANIYTATMYYYQSVSYR